MRIQSTNLQFISQIKRDGTGTIPVLFNPDEKDMFELNCLSITEGTYIASGFNSYIVKLKNPLPEMDETKLRIVELEAENLRMDRIIKILCSDLKPK